MLIRKPYQRTRFGRRQGPTHNKIFLGLLILALFTFVKVWQKTNVDYQYRRNDLLKMELNFLQSENALLAAQIENLRSADRVTQIASERMHLIYVPQIQLQEKTIFERLTAKLDKLQR